MTFAVLLAALAVAFANGANDNFKGVATLHGSGALSYRAALAWATIATLAGSLSAVFLAGGLVRRFSGKGLVPDAIAAEPAFVLAVAVGSAATVLLASRLGFPVSTTHALTGALIGAGVVRAGVSHVSYATLGSAFVLPLMLSPILSLSLASVLYLALRGTGRVLGISEQTCVCVGGEPLAASVPGAGAVRLSSGLTVAVDHLETCRRRYGGTMLGFDAGSALDRLHVLSAGAVSYARALNDTPKMVALLLAARAVGIEAGTALVSAVIACGGLLGARRVARTLSFGITGMDHVQGFSANVVTAILVALASPLGLPVSTTHVSCGALFGIGAVNGRGRWRMVTRILAAWVTTLPAAALLAAAPAALAP